MNISTVKKFFAAGAVLVFSAALLTGCGGDSASAKKFLNIGTGGTAGTYYPIGGAIAEILNKEIPGMNASAQSTGASVANINMLRDKAIDLATVQNDITYYAVTGTEMFDGKKVDGLQGIASLYPETCQFVTLQSSGIKSIADLKGKRVAVGAAGSGVEANVRQILAAYGVSYNDIDAQFLSFAEGASALKDGNVDVAVLTAGYPTASVQDIASQNPVRLLPVEEKVADELIAKYPFYTKTTIPAGTYAGFDEAVPGVSVMAMLVAGPSVDADMGYSITKAIFTHLDRLQAAHAVGKQITKDTAEDGMSLPMNPGRPCFSSRLTFSLRRRSSCTRAVRRPFSCGRSAERARRSRCGSSTPCRRRLWRSSSPFIRMDISTSRARAISRMAWGCPFSPRREHFARRMDISSSIWIVTMTP